jgi:hypothetical protein
LLHLPLVKRFLKIKQRLKARVIDKSTPKNLWIFTCARLAMQLLTQKRLSQFASGADTVYNLVKLELTVTVGQPEKFDTDDATNGGDRGDDAFAAARMTLIGLLRLPGGRRRPRL